jgi:hypothetical protein
VVAGGVVEVGRRARGDLGNFLELIKEKSMTGWTRSPTLLLPLRTRFSSESVESLEKIESETEVVPVEEGTKREKKREKGLVQSPGRPRAFFASALLLRKEIYTLRSRLLFLPLLLPPQRKTTTTTRNRRRTLYRPRPRPRPAIPPPRPPPCWFCVERERVSTERREEVGSRRKRRT